MAGAPDRAPRTGHQGGGGWSLVEATPVSDGGRFAATGDAQLGEEVVEVSAGRLLGENEGLAALRVLEFLPSVASKDICSGRSTVPIDPCRSPLPAPAGSHYY
jgi:hypothetical protein